MEPIVPFPAYHRTTNAEPSFQGIALNVQLPEAVLEMVKRQHAEIQQLALAVQSLAEQQRTQTELLHRLVSNPPHPTVNVGHRRMRRTPVRDAKGQIEYVVDEEF